VKSEKVQRLRKSKESEEFFRKAIKQNEKNRTERIENVKGHTIQSTYHSHFFFCPSSTSLGVVELLLCADDNFELFHHVLCAKVLIQFYLSIFRYFVASSFSFSYSFSFSLFSLLFLSLLSVFGGLLSSLVAKVYFLSRVSLFVYLFILFLRFCFH
jgi:hypothetical protein